MRSFGDKRSIYNGESKTEEDKSTLFNTIDNLFFSFVINDDANTTLCHLAIKMKSMHTYEPFEECSGVVASVRNEIMADIFNALVKGFKKVGKYLPGDIEGRGRSELMVTWGRVI